jgi:hypothetical protein
MCIWQLVGVGGVLIMLIGRIRWVCGRISRGVGVCFLFILDLILEMALKLNSSMTCGVRRRPLRKLFWIYIVLLV